MTRGWINKKSDHDQTIVQIYETSAGDLHFKYSVALELENDIAIQIFIWYNW